MIVFQNQHNAFMESRTVSVMKVAHYLSLPKKNRDTFSMVILKVVYHNELLLQKFFEAYAIDPKQYINQPKHQQLINFGTINQKN